MSKLLGLIGFFIVVTFSVKGQKPEGRKALDIPQQLILPERDINLFKLKYSESLAGNIWEVYSDRTINKTYTKPGGGSPYKFLQYLDKYFVVEVKKKYLRIVKDDSLGSDGVFSKYAEDYGWISSENLLVWSHCLVDEKKQNIRLFIFNTKNTGIYFAGKNSSGQQEPKTFQIVYLFKEGNDKYLIGKSVRLPASKKQIDDHIIGWVDKEIVKSFPSNTFAEPNIYGEKISETILNPVFSDKRSLQKAFNKGKINEDKILFKVDAGGAFELPPVFFRFPVISLDDSTAEVLCYNPGLMEKKVGLFDPALEKNRFYEGYCNISTDSNLMSYHEVMLLSKVKMAELLGDIDFLIKILSNEQDEPVITQEIGERFPLFAEDQDEDTPGQQINVSKLFQRKYDCLSTGKLDTPVLNLILSDNIAKREYIDALKKKIRELSFIYNNTDSDRFFVSNGTNYYWIDCRFLP
jgi:hypothetical protein